MRHERHLSDQSRLPFQVALPFDEAAMEVLDWLDSSRFEWDMYVDLPENCIRYCFRRLADATSFKRRFKDAQERRLTPDNDHDSTNKDIGDPRAQDWDTVYELIKARK